jgi:predicted enzyme related to lactoylglutathione lyase
VCGAILVSRDPEALARFYGGVLGVSFTREDHAGLAPHWGVDLGSVHFGIHPPANFQRTAAGPGGVVLAFDVPSLHDCEARLDALGAERLRPRHEEGFGPVASFLDPEGHEFELVELAYAFGPATPTAAG